MKIVIDTNVLISGAFFSGAPSKILDACLAGQFRLALSAEIVEEYRRVGEVFTNKQPISILRDFLALLFQGLSLSNPD